jgi:hypothetical protein
MESKLTLDLVISPKSNMGAIYNQEHFKGKARIKGVFTFSDREGLKSKIEDNDKLRYNLHFLGDDDVVIFKNCRLFILDNEFEFTSPEYGTVKLIEHWRKEKIDSVLECE